VEFLQHWAQSAAGRTSPHRIFWRSTEKKF
jgi:hypothetical protein